MTGWAQTLSIATPIGVAVLGGAFALWTKRLSKRTDVATAVKTENEGHAVDIQTARALLEDVKVLAAEERSRRLEDKAESKVEIAEVRTELRSVEKRLSHTHHQLMTLIAQMVRHRPWDEAAYAALTSEEPDYPPPPPIDAIDSIADDWLNRH